VDVLILGDPNDGPNFLGLLLEIKRLRPNVATTILTIESDMIREALEKGILEITGAYHDIRSGVLEWLDS
jgi:hypothetical protein